MACAAPLPQRKREDAAPRPVRRVGSGDIVFLRLEFFALKQSIFYEIHSKRSHLNLLILFCVVLLKI